MRLTKVGPDWEARQKIIPNLDKLLEISEEEEKRLQEAEAVSKDTPISSETELNLHEDTHEDVTSAPNHGIIEASVPIMGGSHTHEDVGFNHHEYQKKWRKEKKDVIQIQLAKGEREYWKREASKRGLSLSEMIRSLVNAHLHEDTHE